jgi:hypothetical protein
VAQADCGDALSIERGMDQKVLETLKRGPRTVSSVSSVWFGVDNRDVERSFQRLRAAGRIVYAGTCSWRLA